MAKKKLVENFQLDELDFKLSMLIGAVKGSLSRKDTIERLEYIQQFLRENIMQKMKEEKNDIKRICYTLMMAYKKCKDEENNKMYYQIYKEIDRYEEKLLANGVKKEEIDWIDFYFFCQQQS